MANGNEKEKSITPSGSLGRPLFRPDDMERFFERAMRVMGPWPFRRLGLFHEPLFKDVEWMPAIDVFHKEGKLVVKADLPGMKKEDIDVSIENDMLVISGHRQQEKEIKEKGYYSSERSSGAFSRAISLPEGVKHGSIIANYKDGVLEVMVPLPESKAAKKVKLPIK